MAAVLAATLPECIRCEQPMRRAAHAASGGLCSACGVSSPHALADAAARSKGHPRETP